MDIATILKKLDISGFKILMLRLFGTDEALYDYIVEKANTAVNALIGQNYGTIQAIREKLVTINGYALKYQNWIPPAWLPYAKDINDCIKSVYDATSDSTVTIDEGNEIINRFRIAYSRYMAD